MNDQPMSEDYASLEVKYPEGTEVRHSPDLLAPNSKDHFYFYFNRYAEEMARWLRALGLLLIVFWVTPTHAQETGLGIICDTVAQLSQVIVAADRSVEVAIEKVNATAGSNACGRVMMAFVQKGKVGELFVDAGRYDLYEIVVIGAYDGGEWRVMSPMTQYTAKFVPMEKS